MDPGIQSRGEAHAMRLHPMRSAIALVLTAAMLLFIPAPEAQAAKTRVKAKVGQNRWRPVHTYIGKGDVVVWKNPRPANVSKRRVHDVTSIQPRRWKKRLGFRLNKTLQPGDKIKRKFRRKGTYRFRCARHSAMVDGRCQGMCGFIHVL